MKSHEGPEAAEASQALGARAFAHGNAVAFGSPPDLHTAAHEAAHVVQQRGGVQLKGGIDQPGDAYEQHADAVADAVVAGKSAAPLLDSVGSGGPQQSAVQRAPATPGTGKDAVVAPPRAGIDKVGFIDHSDGANLRTGPAESGGQTVRAAPLPPATRVFVSGTHPEAPQWWYVTAHIEGTMLRGYVQGLRVNTDLPETLAELHDVKGGETAEQYAKQKFGAAVSDGHDLRYYENVLLYVNQQRGRAGINGSYQDPGVLGGGSNNVQLTAGHRIWLVSAPYAKALQSVVPRGSLTGGAVAKVKRFVGHIEDILRSVTESRHHFGEVAGEYAQAIRDHLPEIAGIVAAFIMAEATSAFLAATPTGVGQLAAVVIQLALAAFGAAGLVTASVEAVKHASQWLTLAWTANGKDESIIAASKEFLKMLVSVAMAALSYVGVKGNYGNALKIASSMPTGGLPALAIAGGGQLGGGAGVGTGVLLGPSTGSIGAGGNAMMQSDKDGDAGKAEEDAAAKRAAEKKAAQDAGKEPVHKGGIEQDPQSAYHGKWDGNGVHDWGELETICKRDGYRIKSATEDPSTGTRRVEVERIGVDPKTKAPVVGTVKKTIYPKALTAAQIDEAGALALKSAVAKEPGAKLDPYGTKLKADGSPADGFFEATVKIGSPPRPLKVQGWFKEASDGGKVITSHAPANDKTWPTVDPKDY